MERKTPRPRDQRVILLPLVDLSIDVGIIKANLLTTKHIRYKAKSELQIVITHHTITSMNLHDPKEEQIFPVSQEVMPIVERIAN